MSLSEPFIRRPVGTTLLALGVLLAGIMAYRLLPVAAVPSIPIPGIVVFASEPGASPLVMANTVAAPLEHTLGLIPGLDEVRSISSLGSTSIILLFRTNTNISSDAHAVQAGIDAALPNLPSGMPSLPYYREFNPASRPVLTMFMSSRTMSLRNVYDFANTVLLQKLSQVKGVAQVTLYGGQSPAVRIRFSPHALAAAGLTPNNIFNAVRTANVLEPLGTIQGRHHGYILALNGQLRDAAQYREVALQAGNGTILRLGQVASVVNSVANTQLAATNGREPGIMIAVTKTPSANVIQTVRGIKRQLPNLERLMPPSIHLSILTDRTATIRASISDIEITLLITMVLVLVVVALFMRRGAPILAAGITVPLAIAGTLAAIWALGFSLDNFSLLALTISITFVIDDAIVMIENIVAHHERGLPVMASALQGARQIGFTVFSITLSLIVVFLPLVLMGGIVGGLFHEFATTLVVAIAISGLASLTVTPMICAHLMKDREPARKRSWSMPRLAQSVGRLYQSIVDGYARSLDWALGHQRLMLVLFILTIAFTIFLYIKVPKTFFPEEDTGLVIGRTLAAPDVSFDRMKRLQSRVVQIIRKDPAIATISSSVGVTNGFSSANRGTMFIGLKPASKRSQPAKLVILDLERKLDKIPGIHVYLQIAQDLFFGGQSNGGEYSFSVLDPSFAFLDQITERIVRRLKTLKSINTVSTDLNRAETQITVDINRTRAARLGVSVAAIDAALGEAFGQRPISRIYEAQNQYEVVLTVGAARARTPQDLGDIYVAGASGPVPLLQVARLTRGSAPLQVIHFDGEPEGTISFNVAPGVGLGPAITNVRQVIASMRLPAGVRIRFGGNAKYFLRSIEDVPLLILASLLGIYIVLGVLYESLSQPLTILSTLPSAGVGALLAFFLTGTPMSVIGVIGIFLLMGIVKKNGIMLVDFALETERRDGLSPQEAIRKACLVRFRPIMMTTLAAILGALPLAFAVGTGYQLRRPLGIAVIGGLIVSQAMTLYTTPVIYLVLTGFGKRRARRIADLSDTPASRSPGWAGSS
ncbi:multidrug efflux system subunit MdtC [mine drainage metagenome]|uniref:Multidrug efflux system subunit MdtC n=2 Tax=mine drainage metagenome TaxID=410659 RepID=T1BNG8_9ZZZZ